MTMIRITRTHAPIFNVSFKRYGALSVLKVGTLTVTLTRSKVKKMHTAKHPRSPAMTLDCNHTRLHVDQPSRMDSILSRLRNADFNGEVPALRLASDSQSPILWESDDWATTAHPSPANSTIGHSTGLISESHSLAALDSRYNQWYADSVNQQVAMGIAMCVLWPAVAIASLVIAASISPEVYDWMLGISIWG